MQKVQQAFGAFLAGNLNRRAPRQRRAVKLPVNIGRHEDMGTIRVKHMIVVQGRHAAQVDLLQDRPINRQTPKQTVTVQDQRITLKRPVRGLKQ